MIKFLQLCCFPVYFGRELASKDGSIIPRAPNPVTSGNPSVACPSSNKEESVTVLILCAEGWCLLSYGENEEIWSWTYLKKGMLQ